MARPLKGKEKRVHDDKPNLDKRISRHNTGGGTMKYGKHISSLNRGSNVSRDPKSIQRDGKLLQK